MAISVAVAVGRWATGSWTRSPSASRRCSIGDGAPGRDMGPLISAQHRDKVAPYLTRGWRRGATVVVDGRPDTRSSTALTGFWLGPTLLDHVTST